MSTIQMNQISAIVLAAGKSSRMGEQKMLLPWGGKTVLGQVISTIKTAGVKNVTVVIGGNRNFIEPESLMWGACPVFNPDFEEGEMLSSIQTGIRSLPEDSRICVIALGDNPQIQAEIVKELLKEVIGKESPPRILFPSYQLHRGHPWLIHRMYWDEILKIQPPETMRDFFQRHSSDISYKIVDSDSILMDLDTPEDYMREKPKNKGVKTWILKEDDLPLELEIEADSLDAVNLLLPTGVYTTFRTYHKDLALHLDAHIQRLVQSASLLGHNLILDSGEIRKNLRSILIDMPDGEYRIRIIVGFVEQIQQIYFGLESLHLLPQQAYDQGVKVVISDTRRSNPKAKSSAFIQTAHNARNQLEPGVNEALMVNEKGVILEGLSSNFFAVKNGTIYTAGEEILEGITRELVVSCIQKLQFPIVFSGVDIHEIHHMDECFITSASRGVLPVVQIGNNVIGNGKPGQVTRAIAETFKQFVESEVLEI